MCKAKHYSEQLLKTYEKIDEDIRLLYLQLSRLDGLQQDILHIIENGNFNASEGYLLARMIKNARIERRDVKIELDTLNNLKRNFCDKSINRLKFTSNSIKDQDNTLLKLREERVYNPKVLDTTDLKLVVSG